MERALQSLTMAFWGLFSLASYLATSFISTLIGYRFGRKDRLKLAQLNERAIKAQARGEYLATIREMREQNDYLDAIVHRLRLEAMERENRCEKDRATLREANLKLDAELQTYKLGLKP